MSTLLRGNMPDMYLEDALPFLEHVIEEKYEAFPKVHEKVFNVKDMTAGISQHTQVSALSAAGEVAEGEEIRQDRVYQGFSTSFKSKKYGLLLATSQEAIDDERFDSLSKNAGKMGRAMASTMEVVAAQVFNDGFTSNGSDGVPLFSTAHPLIAPGSGTSSNRLAVDADLSSTSLKDIVTLMRKTLDTAGNKIQIKPKYLLVPAELEFVAYELLRSVYLPDSNNNNINSIGPSGQYIIEPICWDYLTDADAFFVLADKMETELHWFWSKQPEIKSQVEFKTDVALTRILSRFTCGYSDWRGIVGTPGA